MRLQFPTAFWQSNRLRPAPFPELLWEFRDAEMAQAYELDQAVEHWLTQGDWPPLTAEQSMFLAVRLEVAYWLCHELADGPIPVPADERALRQWLLVEYWERRGPANAVRAWITSRWDEQFPED